MEYDDDPWHWRMWLHEWKRFKEARFIALIIGIPGSIIAISQGKLLAGLGAVALATLPWLLCRHIERSNKASLDLRQQLRQPASKTSADVSLRTGKPREPKTNS